MLNGVLQSVGQHNETAPLAAAVPRVTGVTQHINVQQSWNNRQERDDAA